MRRAAVRQAPRSPTRLCQGGDVTCNCAHPSPRNRAARRSRGLCRVAQTLSRRASGVRVRQLTVPHTVSCLFLFLFFPFLFVAGVRNRLAALTIHTDSGKTLWAVFKNGHRPHPCTDNTFSSSSILEHQTEGNSEAKTDSENETFFSLFFLQCEAVAWHSPLCQGSPVMTELGRRECFPPVKRVCLGGGKITG